MTNGAGAESESEIQLFSAEFLLKNPAGVSLVLSSLFLVTGASYNLGLFFLIDPKLVSVLPLTDHISTSISILLTLIPLGLLLLLGSSVILAILLGVLLLVAKIRDASRSSGRTSENVETETASETRPSSGENMEKKRSDFVFEEFLGDHAIIVWPILCNFVMFLFVYFVAVPDQMRDRFDTLGILLIIVGVVGIFLYLKHIEANKEKSEGTRSARGYFKFAGFFILLYLIPFQLGVFEAGSGYSYIYDEAHSRPYSINDRKEAHLLRAGSNGVFFAIKSNDKSSPGSVRFEPWSKVERLEYRLRLP